ncbi:hypothetical protein ACFQBQ_05850 [Granulicella cerasi]|uniref:Uncharacterized protein n=1 Tax=Granulicella cerasi TaxID=741063 RepID=A0ABW1Z7Q3_9BACT|nr:hypothetical protein [Granulicella cerasi]
MPTPVEIPHARRWFWLALGFCTLLILLCTVPYHFPVRPTASFSYLFGYNNRVAVALVALGILGTLAFGPSLPAPTTPASGKLASRTILFASIGTALICVFFYILTRQLNGFDESIYLIDRVWHAAQGQRPYVDFEYAYGAAFLYGPALLIRGLGLPLADAYCLFWTLVSIVGVLMLAQVVRWSTEGRSSHPTAVLLILWAANIPGMLTTGINYSLLRFVSPCFFALLTFRALQGASPNRWRNAALGAVGSMALLLLISPELAIAFAIGTVAFYLWSLYLSPEREAGAWALALLLGDGCLAALANHLHAFDTLKAFSQGGMNFPINANLFTLLFLLAVAIAACYTATGLRNRTPDAWIMLAAVSFPAIPAALGRFDPPHLWNNPYGVILVALLVAASFRSSWRIVAPVAAVILALLPCVVSFNIQRANLGKAAILFGLAWEPKSPEISAFDRWALRRIGKELGPAVALQKLENYKAFTHATAPTPAKAFGLPANTLFEAPYTYSPSRFGVTHAQELRDGYFFGILNAVTIDELKQKIAEMEGHPDAVLLLLPDQIGDCAFSEDGPRHSINIILLTRYTAPLRHRDPAEANLCRYIRDHYQLSEPAAPEHYGYELWRRRP